MDHQSGEDSVLIIVEGHPFAARCGGSITDLRNHAVQNACAAPATLIAKA